GAGDFARTRDRGIRATAGTRDATSGRVYASLEPRGVTLMKIWIRKHPLASYFILAYAVSWSVGVPLALQAQGVTAQRLPWSFHYLTAFGPAIAAFVIARLVRSPSGTSRSG